MSLCPDAAGDGLERGVSGVTGGDEQPVPFAGQVGEGEGFGEFGGDGVRPRRASRLRARPGPGWCVGMEARISTRSMPRVQNSLFVGDERDVHELFGGAGALEVRALGSR